MDKITVLILFFLLVISNVAQSQFTTKADIGKYFYGIGTDAYAFTDKNVWISSGNGIAKVDSNGVVFYQFQITSAGNILNYVVSKDSAKNYSNGIDFHLIQTNRDEVWLAPMKNEGRLLKIKDDTVYNYYIEKSDKIKYKSYFCDNGGTMWFHFVKNSEPMFEHYIYKLENDSLNLIYKLNSSISGYYHSYFFRFKDKCLIGEDEEDNNFVYFAIYEIQNGKKSLFYKFDSNLGSYYSSHYYYKDELYILTSSCKLLKIDSDKNVRSYNFGLKDCMPSRNFYILDDNLFCSLKNNIVKISLTTEEKKQSNYIRISNDCDGIIKGIYLSRDKYIYCCLIGDKKDDYRNFITAPECQSGDNLRIVSINF